MLGLILAVAMAQATAEISPPKPSLVTYPDWLRKPDGTALMRYYPEAAQRKNLPGRAVFECQVVADGSLTGCKVIEESPPGEGFGDAALKLAALFRMRPMTRNGVPVDGGTIRVPIRFQLGNQLDTMSAELSCYGQAAALAEREPGSVEAWTAVTFYSAQVAVQTAMAKSTPTTLEQSLSASHMAAARAMQPSPNDPGLRNCLNFAAKHMKPVIPSP